VLRLPFQRFQATAKPGEGFAITASGSAILEKLPDFLAAAQSIGRAPAGDLARAKTSNVSRKADPVTAAEEKSDLTGGNGPIVELSSSLPALFVDSLSGRVQRSILQALNGQGRVRTADVMQAVYGKNCKDKAEAFDKAIDRLNAKLAASDYRYQICREGKTLLLSAL
jgi:hypothetical protein